MGGLEAVDRDREAGQASGDHGLDALGVEVVGAGGHGAGHAGLADGADDEDEVVAQVGLAADQDDLAAAEVLELLHDGEALVGAELVGAAVAGPRSAMGTLLIAGEGELPDRPARALDGGVGATPAIARRWQGGDDGQAAANIGERHATTLPRKLSRTGAGRDGPG